MKAANEMVRVLRDAARRAGLCCPAGGADARVASAWVPSVDGGVSECMSVCRSQRQRPVGTSSTSSCEYFNLVFTIPVTGSEETTRDYIPITDS